MAKQKLKRFEAFTNYNNTYHFPYELKGKWHSRVFKNNNPIVLELGCGKGEYTIALAQEFKNKNFIGIDIKSNRMWVGATEAVEKNVSNVIFVRALIHRINELFNEGEVSEIWITFPDPFLRIRSAKHRLTHTRFLRLYQQILVNNGAINFKTDSDELFAFTQHQLGMLGIIPQTLHLNVHNDNTAEPLLKNVTTYYEKLFRAKGKTIKFMQFNLTNFTLAKAELYESWYEAERLKLVAEGKSVGI